jgi:hypothetical protein
MLNVDPDALRAAASRWQMIGTDLGEDAAPPVNLEMTWPSAAATDSIHAGAATATQAFQARISETAAASNHAASAYQDHDTVGVGDVKDVMELLTSPVKDMVGIVTPLGSLGASVTGVLGQLGGTLASGTSSVVNALSGSVSHVGSHPQTAAMPLPPQTAAMPLPPQTAAMPLPIDQLHKRFETGQVQ